MYWLLKVTGLDSWDTLVILGPRFIHGALAALTDIALCELTRKIIGERYVSTAVSHFESVQPSAQAFSGKDVVFGVLIDAALTGKSFYLGLVILWSSCLHASHFLRNNLLRVSVF
ncbi:hypothetical protein MPER_10913 [Moniliophthora perniciosa FA553]|nr:hypothetical protein MPER_10913 [Moniliophthora perniciosa FA553]